MSRTLWTTLALAMLLSQTAVSAATVTVSGDVPRESITVTAEDATVDLILKDLHERYGFQIEGLDKANASEAQSVTMTGDLHSILERLLRNWNHMIVRSPDNQSGIDKVMILNSTYGAAPTHNAKGSARGAANSELMQALTGEGMMP